MARNCPDKPWKDKGKVKACTTETGDNNDIATLDDEAAILYQQARAMKEESKIRFVQMAVEAEQGTEGDGLDFYEV